MATYSRSEVTTTRVEFAVPTHEPWGACWVEVEKAFAAATEALREAGRVRRDESPADDLIRLRCADDQLIVFYERPGSSGEVQGA